MLTYVALLALAIAGTSSMDLNRDTPFQHSFDLYPNLYKMYWNYTESEIAIKVEVTSSGWLSFGLSPTGGMYNSDFILAWIDPQNATFMFKDCYFLQSSTIYEDSNSFPKWTLRFHDFTAAKKTVIFSRSLEACYGPNEIALSPTNFVTFSAGDSFNASDFPLYTYNMGRQVVPLLSELNDVEDIELSSFSQYEWSVSSGVSKNLSTLNCIMYQLPAEFKTKRHVVGYKIATSFLTKEYLQAVEMLACAEEYPNSTQSIPAAGNCLSAEWAEARKFCRKVVIAYTAGGDTIVKFPEDKAYPLGGSENWFQYFILLTHLKNKDGTLGVNVPSGFTLYTTLEYRPIEFGVLTVGMDDDHLGLLIPNKLQALEVKGLVRSSFLSKMGRINIFASLSKTFSTGKRTSVKLLRNQTVVDEINVNNYLDPKFQYIKFNQPAISVEDGDELLFSCTYNSANLQLPLIGGETMDNREQCKHNIWYYPYNKNNFLWLNKVPYEDWVGVFKMLNSTGKIQWSWNGEKTQMFNTAFLAVLNSPMNDDPAGSEVILQDFYNGANRQKIENFETMVSGDTEKLPQYTESDCQTPYYTTPGTPGAGNVIKMSVWPILTCLLLLWAA